MKRILITGLFVGLLLVLLVGAVFALKGPASTQTAAPADTTANLAPTATDSYNFIALPLDSTDSFSYTASGLANYVGSSVSAVIKWDATNQQYVTYTPGGPGDFALETGGAYFLLLDSTADNVLSFVGDVPPQGSISFSLVKDTGSGCKYNAISIPLDQGQITMASDLANSIGGVDAVIKWDATNQQYVTYTPGGPGDFAVSIGYPYFVCLNSSAPSTWP